MSCAAPSGADQAFAGEPVAANSVASLRIQKSRFWRTKLGADEAFAAQALNAGGVRNGPVFGAYAAPGWAYSPGHSLSCWSSAFAFLRSGVPKPSVNQP
jgi:hypothetical protein